MTNTDLQALLIMRAHLDLLVAAGKISKEQRDGALKTLKEKVKAQKVEVEDD